MTEFRFGEFRVDPGSRRLEWQGTPVPLTAKQFDLLLAFVERPGVPLSKQELQQRVWPDTFVEENNLTQHIFQLRKALAGVGGETVYIETLPKVGYQFVAPVTTEEVVFVPGRAPAWRWVVGVLVLVLFAGTVGFGKRQWDFWMAEDAPGPEAPKTVAVTPFTTDLGAAFAAEVAGSLGRLDNIQVRVVQPTGFSRSADFTLTGEIEKGKVKAELRRGAEVVWQHEVTGELAAAQAEIATYAAVSLQELGGARRRDMLSRKAPKNQEAYLAYLEGAQALTVRRGDAVGSFQRALAADPEFAGAYAGIALHYMVIGFNQLEDPRVVWERAREYARKALELEPGNGNARMILAYVAAYADQNELRAEGLAREALAGEPGSISLQLLGGQLLARLGRFTESERILRGAVQGDPTLLLGRQILAHHYYLSRQYDLAKREAWRVIRIAPKNGTGYGLLVLPAWATGEWRLASLIAGRAKAAGLNQPMVSMGLAYTYGKTGRTEEARQIVRSMDEMARLSHVSPMQRAVAHLGIGENDEAVRLMQACLASGCVNPSLLRIDPVFDALRGHPGFVAMMR